MIDLRSTLAEIIDQGASDVFIKPGLPLTFKREGQFGSLNDIRLTPQDAKDFLDGLYLYAGNRSEDELILRGEDVFSFTAENVARFRVSAFRHGGSFSAVMRVIPLQLPSPEDLKIPEEVMKLAELTQGIVVVAGKTGSGKSTTLAALLTQIIETRQTHIVTLENPVEFLHSHGKSIISQRELGEDTKSFAEGLRAALLQDADVILLSEAEGVDVISLMMRAAEGGRLVLTAVDAPDAPTAVELLLFPFPPEKHEQIRHRLSENLKAVVTQRLLPEREFEVSGAEKLFTHGDKR